MPLEWDKTGERRYESGVDHGVFYPIDNQGDYTPGVVWNGLTSVSENPDGAEPNELWADNIKYAVLRSAETFGATIEAYTYPEEFEVCDGSVALATGVYAGQQPRKPFGLCYRTKIGTDNGTNEGYKLHLIYNATVTPSDKDYETINDSPDAITFSWELTTTPVTVTGHQPTASIVIDSTKADSTKLATLEAILYGSGTGQSAIPPRLPLPDEVKSTMT